MVVIFANPSVQMYTNFLSNKLKMENKNNFKEQMEYFYRFLSLLYDSIVIDDD